jgi:cytochrome c peroxidase
LRPELRQIKGLEHFSTSRKRRNALTLHIQRRFRSQRSAIGDLSDFNVAVPRNRGHSLVVCPDPEILGIASTREDRRCVCAAAISP